MSYNLNSFLDKDLTYRKMNCITYATSAVSIISAVSGLLMVYSAAASCGQHASVLASFGWSFIVLPFAFFTCISIAAIVANKCFVTQSGKEDKASEAPKSQRIINSILEKAKKRITPMESHNLPSAGYGYRF